MMEFKLGDIKVNISEKLTQQKLLEILKTTYVRGQESENILMVDLIEELKQQVLLVINKNN